MSARPTAMTGLGAVAVLLALVGGILIWTSLVGPKDEPPTPPRAAAAPIESPSSTSRRDSSPPGPPGPPERPGRSAAAMARQSEPSSDTPRRATGIPDMVAGPALDSSTPVRVTVPRIDVSSPLVALGLDASGSMEVPQDPAVAGWYALGPTPGALGPAVIAGHVTWDQAPAIFYRLASLRRGDDVDVAREDGTTAAFRVTRVASFPKTRFPTTAVFGPTGYAGLRLITCGGDYDSSAHRYLHNVVVYARLVTR